MFAALAVPIVSPGAFMTPALDLLPALAFLPAAVPIIVIGVMIVVWPLLMIVASVRIVGLIRIIVIVVAARPEGQRNTGLCGSAGDAATSDAADRAAAIVSLRNMSALLACSYGFNGSRSAR